MDQVHQDTSDLEELFFRADSVQASFSSLLAPIADEFGCKMVIPKTTKGRDRVLSKLKGEYGDDATKLLDLARCTVVVDKEADVLVVLERLREMFEVPRVKYRTHDRQGNVGPEEGRRDVLMNLALPVRGRDRKPSRFLAEVQVQWKPLYETKNGIQRMCFEVKREIIGRAQGEGRLLTSTEKLTIMRLDRASRAIYANAFEPPATRFEKVRSRIEGRLVVEAIGSAGDRHKRIPHYAERAEKFIPDELAVSDDSVRPTAAKRLRDLVAMRAAYVGWRDDKRLSEAIRVVEKAHGIDFTLPVDLRLAAVDVLIKHAVRDIGADALAASGVPLAELPEGAVALDDVQTDELSSLKAATMPLVQAVEVAFAANPHAAPGFASRILKRQARTAVSLLESIYRDRAELSARLADIGSRSPVRSSIRKGRDGDSSGVDRRDGTFDAITAAASRIESNAEYVGGVVESIAKVLPGLLSGEIEIVSGIVEETLLKTDGFDEDGPRGFEGVTGSARHSLQRLSKRLASVAEANGIDMSGGKSARR